MNRAVKIGIAGTCTALLALGGIGAYNVVQAMSSGPTGSGEKASAYRSMGVVSRTGFWIG
ncbi:MULTISPECIES: hypothetical protein [unclassified Streptomyces]|uniref:hypothetical protein n=1 Tax=unclassified Streptomyces TaxID=2593676 RepID=UPI002E2B48F1|nr:hypothetical protein [Streptomyces sp. NBC_00228]